MSKYNNWLRGGEEFPEDRERGARYERDERRPSQPYGASKYSGGGYKYNTVVVHRPHSAEDVQIIIDCLRRGEPAIINLDRESEASAQRILDFISGAIYALCGRIHRISGDIFLLTPDGMEITVPYDL